DGAVARRRVADQIVEEMMRRMRNVLDGAVERRLVGLGRPREAGELADELQRAGANFLVARRRLEIVQRFDVPAHGGVSQEVTRNETSPGRRRRQSPARRPYPNQAVIAAADGYDRDKRFCRRRAV